MLAIGLREHRPHSPRELVSCVSPCWSARTTRARRCIRHEPHGSGRAELVASGSRGDGAGVAAQAPGHREAMEPGRHSRAILADSLRLSRRARDCVDGRQPQHSRRYRSGRRGPHRDFPGHERYRLRTDVRAARRRFRHGSCVWRSNRGVYGVDLLPERITRARARARGPRAHLVRVLARPRIHTGGEWRPHHASVVLAGDHAARERSSASTDTGRLPMAPATFAPLSRDRCSQWHSTRDGW